MWYTNRLAIRGTNFFIPHAFFFGIEDGRGEDRPPDVGLHSIWEPYWDRIATYMKRLSWLGTDSRRQIRAAVLCDNNRVPGEEIAALSEYQIDFRYVPLGRLDRCRIAGGKLYAGEDCFDVVLNTLGEEARERFCGHFAGEDLPVLVTEVREVVERVSPAVCTEKPEGSLRAFRIEKEGADMLLVSNEGNTALETHLSIPGAEGAVSGMDLWKGSVFLPETGSQGILVRLDPCEMRLYLLNPEEEAVTKAAGQICPDTVSWKDLTERLTLTEEGQNTKTYSCQVSPEERFITVTGEEMAECWCDGSFADASFVSPHRFILPANQDSRERNVVIRLTGNAANLHNLDILAGTAEPIPFGAGVPGPA